MVDIFNNYELQREELLARIAQALQLDETRKKRMEDAYNSISTLVNEDQGFFKNVDIDVYPQGSIAIGATSKPLNGNEFDLDIVLHIKKLYSYYTPQQIYNELLKLLESDVRYSDKVEKKNRCIRLNYAGDFHMDILPGCIVTLFDYKNIKIPDRKLKDWANSNPKGYAEAFLKKAQTIRERSLLAGLRNKLIDLKAEIQDLPSDDFYSKTPLQRSVQLIKRYRDIYFEDKKEFATSSIVITTLMMVHYNGENSIYSTIDNILLKIKTAYNNAIALKQKFKVPNPVNPNEYFTDSWTDQHYTSFFAFVTDLYAKWQELKHEFKRSGPEFVTLFGEGLYKQSLQEQIKLMGKYSSDIITKANSIIISDAAFTNQRGQIQTNNGFKNEKHHNFGE